MQTNDQLIDFVLPWPKSINHAIGGGVRRGIQVSREKQDYKAASYYAIRSQLGSAWFDRGYAPDTELAILIGLCPPDNSRKRDIDNGLKWILDALEYAGIVENDSQFRSLSVDWFDLTPPGGAVTVMCHPLEGPSLAARASHERLASRLIDPRSRTTGVMHS